MPEVFHFRDKSAYLKEQLITCIGNKRALLPRLADSFSRLEKSLGRKLRCWDAFSGSGSVSRLLKSYASELHSNDLEPYAAMMSRCYLANRNELPMAQLQSIYSSLLDELSDEGNLQAGFVTELYAPKDESSIAREDRVFYTRRNALYIDTARMLISELDEEIQPFFLAPLLSMASVHTNTAGVFKGFYKNAEGIGQYGGRGEHALSRIKGDITLPFPVFSEFNCPTTVTRADALTVAHHLPDLDLAYFDPPYNQHPYGSNYFMLNLIVEGKAPDTSQISRVSGIPQDWNRSEFNKKAGALRALSELVSRCPARYILLSYSSEGLLAKSDMLDLLASHGTVTLEEIPYATFRGSRNLRARKLQVMEYLFLLEKKI